MGPPDELEWLLSSAFRNEWTDPAADFDTEVALSMLSESRMPPSHKWPDDLTEEHEIFEPDPRGPRFAQVRELASGKVGFHLSVLYPANQQATEYNWWPMFRPGPVAALIEFEVHYPQPMSRLDPHSDFRYQMLRSEGFTTPKLLDWVSTLDLSAIQTLCAPGSNAEAASALEQLARGDADHPNVFDEDTLEAFSTNLVRSRWLLEATEKMIARHAMVALDQGDLNPSELASLVGMSEVELVELVGQVQRLPGHDRSRTRRHAPPA